MVTSGSDLGFRPYSGALTPSQAAWKRSKRQARTFSTSSSLPESLAREAARRAVCLSNLRQMQIAWQTYADEHEGCIVNGQPCSSPKGSEIAKNCGKEWLIGGWSGGLPNPQTAPDGEGLMRTGALASYVGDVGVYLCPSRYRRTRWREC